MAAYYVTSLGGLEAIVRREIAERFPGATIEVSAQAGERGRTFLSYDGFPADVLALRSVENVFAAVAQFDRLSADESGLQAIRAWAAASDLSGAAAVHAQVYGPRESPSFRCTSKRLGEHAFGSMDIMAAAGAGIVDRYGWRVDLEGYDYDIHVDVEEDRCTIGLRITPVSLRRRGRIAHVAASLNPTLGYAMCVLSDPQPGEVFVDPTCGAGTVLLERAEIGPARLVAGDLFAHPLEMARRNLLANAVEAHLFRWDARRLPLAPESVDKVCANLPWGRRAGSHLVNKHLYPPLVREIARVLKVGGRAVLLSLEKRMLLACVDRHGWLRIADVLPVSVAGLKPAIYVIEKWRGHKRPPDA
jgi:tRNA (guanine6-N2)-methyltransferase